MKRFGVALRFGAALATVALVAMPRAGTTRAAPPTPYTADKAVKINVMGEWAHPDDDTSIIGPCGVWHQLYGTRCGIIQVTRGEGGGNAVGDETGTALGLRRENEDRSAHYRSGTVDIFYVDKVDFFYNQSAPLTQYFWGHDDALRRITRIIRTTQPDIYIGFTPTLAAGHGNHQEAGRLIWEGVLAAADPTMFPDQLTGPNALSTWQIKKVFSGGSTAGTGGTLSPNCTTGFLPAATNLDTVAGVWTGYASPYLWPAGNIQGQPAGSPKTWAQVASEGRAAYPTQSRTMFMGTAAPTCSRFGQTESFVPFQPNTMPDGTANPNAGRDDAILYGASVQDPGGLPLGTLEYITFSRFFNVAGVAFQATVHVKAGSAAALLAGSVALTVPAGWTVDPAQAIGPITSAQESTATFTITPSGAAAANTNFKISALLTAGGKTGYTDNVVRIVPAAEGRFHRWGNWAEYDSWLQNTAPQAYRLGRSAAVQSIGVGETITVPVDVHNWSNVSQSGDVSLTLPSDFTVDAASKPYGPLAPGGDTQVVFTLTNTDTSLPANQSTNVPITTTYSSPTSGSSGETLALSIVPATSIPQAAAAPTLDGQESPGEYPGPALDISRLWQGSPCSPAGVDCGTSGVVGGPTSTYAKVTWNNDNLYFFVHVVDDYQSYAVTPQQCVAHWLADSVEILIDPRGNSSQTLMDTATAFKLGIFPFTKDPANFNGNGVNGPCWERDADNHQGYATGPLAATVEGAPNAPGVQVVSTATWVGSNETTVDHGYTGGGYSLEVKIPMADLPSAAGPADAPPTGSAATNVVNPLHMGLNITPYIEDNTAAPGTTTLRHIDQSTRLAWSAFGSVQSDPYRWGHAYLSGYTPPAGRSTTPSAPIVGHPNLDGANSPQTIYQSAQDGVPISGRDPAPANDRIAIARPTLGASAAEFDILATGPGTAHVFLWSGDHANIPVWLTSCSPTADPAPDYGFTACAVTDGGIPAWQPDMSGRVVRDITVPVASAGLQHVSIPLDPAAYARLAANGSALVSFETPNNEVQAFYIPLAQTSGG